MKLNEALSSKKLQRLYNEHGGFSDFSKAGFSELTDDNIGEFLTKKQVEEMNYLPISQRPNLENAIFFKDGSAVLINPDIDAKPYGGALGKTKAFNSGFDRSELRRRNRKNGYYQDPMNHTQERLRKKAITKIFSDFVRQHPQNCRMSNGWIVTNSEQIANEIENRINDYNKRVTAPLKYYPAFDTEYGHMYIRDYRKNLFKFYNPAAGTQNLDLNPNDVDYNEKLSTFNDTIKNIREAKLDDLIDECVKRVISKLHGKS